MTDTSKLGRDLGMLFIALSQLYDSIPLGEFREIILDIAQVTKGDNADEIACLIAEFYAVELPEEL